MDVKIITPESTLFTGTAEQVQVPGALGDFGVLPGHAPFISTIRPGVVTIEAAGKVSKIAVVGGIAEVTPERCTLLIERAIDCTEYSQADIAALQAKAKQQAEEAETDEQRDAAEASQHMADAVAAAF